MINVCRHLITGDPTCDLFVTFDAESGSFRNIVNQHVTECHLGHVPFYDFFQKVNEVQANGHSGDIYGDMHYKNQVSIFWANLP